MTRGEAFDLIAKIMEEERYFNLCGDYSFFSMVTLPDLLARVT